ncbi:hypothetical protein PC39_10842 [Salinisphaera sp. PC39]|uniref:patatin-like phospholipase RssA n=1 Tax=Salinisphaera sp. PC39 TaxID=1304156 RepID=UPI00333EEE32
MKHGKEPALGLALGSGSARGWTHIGVIQALEDMGVRPKVIAGTSIGALVGAVYVSGQLDAFADWVRRLTVRDVFNLMDLGFSGGMVKGEKLFGFFQDGYRNPDIESLDQRYVSVATDMHTGRESWLTRGPILPAARASCALPGLFSPVKFGERWMLDGGLVNPVPVSAARALGADVVIAVNLNAKLVGTRMSSSGRRQIAHEANAEGEAGFWRKMLTHLSSNDDEPGLFDVITASVNIMQDRITRSRMAGDPPEITLAPLLPDLAFLDFHRADEAIAEGRRLVEEHADIIHAWLGDRPADQPAD